MHMQNLIRFYQFVHKTLSENEILTTTKSHKHVVILRKLTWNNPDPDLVRFNAYEKFDQTQSNRLSRNEILTTSKGHNHVVNFRKLTRNNPNVDLVNVNTYARFGLIPSIRSQHIERKLRRNPGMTDKLKTVYPHPTNICMPGYNTSFAHFPWLCWHFMRNHWFFLLCSSEFIAIRTLANCVFYLISRSWPKEKTSVNRLMHLFIPR